MFTEVRVRKSGHTFMTGGHCPSFLDTPEGRNQRVPKRMERAMEPTRNMAPAIVWLPLKKVYEPPAIIAIDMKRYK
jgi:hypothetical protein